MINKLFANRTLLITGGTGSFGSTILKELLKTKIKEIRILSRDELKQFNLRAKFPDKRIKYFLGDVRDFDSISYVFKNVHYVFHAAALKQVPSCEFQPEEAFKTNVLGSKNVIDSCINNNISKAIFLSTDKAVNPINVMGMTKSLMEKLVVSYGRKMQQKIIIRQEVQWMHLVVGYFWPKRRCWRRVMTILCPFYVQKYYQYLELYWRQMATYYLSLYKIALLKTLSMSRCITQLGGFFIC